MAEAEEDKESNILETTGKINETASKGPLSALLSPTFEILGKEAADWTQKKINKRKENNQKHIENVIEAVGGAGVDPSELMIENLREWEETAGYFDDKDEEAALWRGVLEEILTEKTNHSDLIEVAKKLNRFDIDQIERIGDFWEKVHGLEEGKRRTFSRAALSVFDPKRRGRMKGSHKKLVDLNLLFSQRVISIRFAITCLLLLMSFFVFVVASKISPAAFGVFNSVDIALVFVALLGMVALFPTEKTEEIVFLTHTGKKIYWMLKKYGKSD
ncbi:hypothetical protein AB1K42_15815 [Roseibium algicola]|uniref:hypothetical protein n=1 Tax=Roseibium algicola TaxID=2857014 RepID=UPI00345B436B